VNKAFADTEEAVEKHKSSQDPLREELDKLEANLAAAAQANMHKLATVVDAVGGVVVGLANALIANNPHLFEKRLWCQRDEGDRPRVITCRDEVNEAERVVSEILHRRFADQANFGDFAILYRGNHQARLFEQALREHDIPYFLSGGTSFFARAEIKETDKMIRSGLVQPSRKS
jgi:hypothetical protein